MLAAFGKELWKATVEKGQRPPWKNMCTGGGMSRDALRARGMRCKERDTCV
ncbi:hypothetical protein LINPERPRIM_LOCUS27691 [Linum perenne]